MFVKKTATLFAVLVLFFAAQQTQVSSEALIPFLLRLFNVVDTMSNSSCVFGSLIEFFGSNELNDILECVEGQELELLSLKIDALVEDVNGDLPEACTQPKILFSDPEIMRVCSGVITTDSLLKLMEDQEFMQTALNIFEGCVFEFLYKSKVVYDFMAARCQ